MMSRRIRYKIQTRCRNKRDYLFTDSSSQGSVLSLCALAFSDSGSVPASHPYHTVWYSSASAKRRSRKGKRRGASCRTSDSVKRFVEYPLFIVSQTKRKKIFCGYELSGISVILKLLKKYIIHFYSHFRQLTG